MIKLSVLINETQIIHDLYRHLSFPAFNKVPLSLPIIKKLVGNVQTIKSAHVTDLKNLPKLYSLQGKKKGISTFNSIGKYSDILRGAGVVTEGGVIAILKGDVVLQSKFDVGSHIDESGRRWIEVEVLFGTELFNVKKSLPSGVSYENKGEWIKAYIDTATKLLLQNKDKFQKLYFGDKNQKKLQGVYAGDWNEIIMVKIQLEEVALIRDSASFEDLSDSEIKDLQKKYKNSKVILMKDIPSFLKKHGVKIN